MSLDTNLLLLLKAAWLGDGEPDLGEKLLKSFLTVLLESGTIPARIICLNSAIFLTTEGSPVADLLRQFEEQGATISSCSTCLEYHGRTDKLIVGVAGNMKGTVEAMLQYGKVLAP